MKDFVYDCDKCSEPIDLKYSVEGVEKDWQKVVCFDCGRINRVSVVRLMQVRVVNSG